MMRQPGALQVGQAPRDSSEASQDAMALASKTWKQVVAAAWVSLVMGSRVMGQAAVEATAAAMRASPTNFGTTVATCARASAGATAGAGAGAGAGATAGAGGARRRCRGASSSSSSSSDSGIGARHRRIHGRRPAGPATGITCIRLSPFAGQSRVFSNSSTGIGTGWNQEWTNCWESRQGPR